MGFLVFEGLDGVGKSTLIKNLEKFLYEKGISFLSTQEPGGTLLGDEIKKLLLSKKSEPPVRKSELLLYEAIRAQHIEKKIKPALKKKKWVLCDRFTASSIAFQSGGRGLLKNDIIWLNQFVCDIEPDLWVYLDLSLDESLKRASGRKKEKDRLEEEGRSFYDRVRLSYKELIQENKENWFLLDARKKPEELLNDLIDELRKRSLLKL